ncbi:MAG: hypothetical protein HWN65_21630 [Candidatus Helarchaeota archaeon]|nr:hypothetical protein [Candidatus Helarchaeota archaeon]
MLAKSQGIIVVTTASEHDPSMPLLDNFPNFPLSKVTKSLVKNKGIKECPIKKGESSYQNKSHWVSSISPIYLKP